MTRSVRHPLQDRPARLARAWRSEEDTAQLERVESRLVRRAALAADMLRAVCVDYASDYYGVDSDPDTDPYDFGGIL